MATGLARYDAWAKCTSFSSELLEVPDIAGLRIDEKGLVVKTEAPDGPDTNTSTDLLLTLALRRRALAADIADACTYETMSAWHEVLLAALLRQPPPATAR